MDPFIEEFRAVPDGDLMLCPDNGVAYQSDMSNQVAYDAAYFDKCDEYTGQEIAIKINAGRVALVNKHVGFFTDVLDIGVGSGEFIKSRPFTMGFDINPKAKAWLEKNSRWSSYIQGFRAFTFWDVIEHVEDPDLYFNRMPTRSFVFVSLPVFADLARIRESKHYRPGEHLYYFSVSGFVDWMSMHDFRILEIDFFEVAAGREDIASFAFQRS